MESTTKTFNYSNGDITVTVKPGEQSYGFVAERKPSVKGYLYENIFFYEVPTNVVERLSDIDPEYVDEFVQASADFLYLASLGNEVLIKGLAGFTGAYLPLVINLCGSYHLCLLESYTQEELDKRFEITEYPEPVKQFFDLYKTFFRDLGDRVAFGLFPDEPQEDTETQEAE